MFSFAKKCGSYLNTFAGKTKTSMFGVVEEVMANVFIDEESKLYKLPAIVCVGNESSGKSSLLESITKCKLLPKNARMGTKCPIHIILNTGSNYFSIEIEGVKTGCKDEHVVYRKLEEYMNELYYNTIIEEEITIRINGPELPCMELYDLPALTIETLDLTKEYLSMNNAIIVCTVPAYYAWFTTCQSLALINEMGLQKSSIIALTMCDYVGDYAEELIINRILGTSDEMCKLKEYAGCVGVVNSTRRDAIRLEKAGTYERNWFEKNVIRHMEESEFSENDIVKMRDHLTIPNLLLKIDELYSASISEERIPKNQQES